MFWIPRKRSAARKQRDPTEPGPTHPRPEPGPTHPRPEPGPTHPRPEPGPTHPRHQELRKIYLEIQLQPLKGNIDLGI